MRKSLIVAAMAIGIAVTLGAGSASAGNYGMAGCGLGSIVIGPKGGILQIFAATSNGTLGNQTFGITTGTSNCTEDASAYLNKQQEMFVTVNKKSLEQEMAAGRGEKLDAFAHLLGCPAGKKSEFSAMAQTSHKKVFSSEATPSEILSAVKTEISSNAALAASCKI
jgi:hypothetical protein